MTPYLHCPCFWLADQAEILKGIEMLLIEIREAKKSGKQPCAYERMQR